MDSLHEAQDSLKGVIHRPARNLAITRFLSLFTLCFLLSVSVLQLWKPVYHVSTIDTVEPHYTTLKPGTISLGPCPSQPEADCGYVIVPTDYFNAGAGVTKLALARYKATKSPRKGTVLLNAGGPGGSTKSMVLQAGHYFQLITGNEYDVVGFDPRGIGDTEPLTECFPASTYPLFHKNTVLDKGFEVERNLSSPSLRDSLLKQQSEADALLRTQFELCGKTMGEALRYMGTSSVVRDIDYMTKLMDGEDALINFYGPSYGTILGQYLVNMLPDRIGRVVIDGVADAVAWSNEPNYKWYRSWLSSTERAYDVFVNECAKAGPERCALAREGDEHPSEIRDRIEAFFDVLLEKPLAVPYPPAPGIITSGRARDYFFRTLQIPRIWQNHSKALSHAMDGDGSLMLQSADIWSFFPHASGLQEGVQAARTGDLARQAVSCNDALPLTPSQSASNEDVIDEYITTLKTVTRFGMSVVTTEPDSGCQYWPVTPPERFSGPWNHTLRNPILIHSNTADPVTPISSGELVKKLLGDSARLAIQDGPGHTSFFHGSLCTVSITQAFFANGTLPEEGHVCGVDEELFPGTDSARVFSVEEQRLLEAVAAVGNAMYRSRMNR